jgi:predicted GH43/DUF377 family glycosyl hydrolase
MFYFYNDASDKYQIGHATSADGITWTKDTANNPILTKSGSGWDDYNVCVPVVWKEESTWYMLYRGRYSGDNAQKIGLATAVEPGGPWTKYASNPVLSGSEAWEIGSSSQSTIDPWGIIKVDGTYYLYYSTISPANYNRSVGVATSTDLHTWTKYGSNPVMIGHRFCVYVFKYGDHYWMVAPKKTVPGETNSETVNRPCFELWRSTSPYFTNPELVRIIYQTSTDDAWNDTTSDCPWILQDSIARDSFPSNKIMLYFSGYDAANWKTGLIEEDDIASALSFV